MKGIKDHFTHGYLVQGFGDILTYSLAAM